MPKQDVLLNDLLIKLISGLLISALLVFQPFYAEAAPKKDINDPVLQEIISKFVTRMPRFITKHGDDIFVADAPLTRGTFMMAINEYDTSLKLNKKDFVSRLEFEDFRTKLNLAGKQGASGNTEKEVSLLISELQPNMPVLLDNSLNNSKVFNALQEEIRGGEMKGQGKSQISKKDFDDLSLKVNSLAAKPGQNGSSFDTIKINREIEELKNRVVTMESASPSKPGASQKEIADLSNRLEILESSIANAPSQAPSGQNEKGSSKTFTRVQQDILALKTKIDITERRLAAADAASKSELEAVQDKVDALQKNTFQSSPSGASGSVSDDVLRKVNNLNSSFTLVQKQSDQSLKLSQNALSDINKVDGDMADMNATISKLRSQMARLESKMDNIDLGGSESGEGQGKKSTLTKVGIGLGIVAAFLVAR